MEERNSLSVKERTEFNELIIKVNSLSEEVVSLRNIFTYLTVKIEVLTKENTSLKGEATRWKQRANTLSEKANKANPEDWKRLQIERENLSKLLTSERKTHAERTEEFNQVKTEKMKLQEQLMQLQRQIQIQDKQMSRALEEIRKLDQELNEALDKEFWTMTFLSKAKNLAFFRRKLDDKNAILNDVKNKGIQTCKIAEKYKTQFEELVRSFEEEKNRNEEIRNEDTFGVTTQEREDQLREEGSQEFRQANIELTIKTDEITRQIVAAQCEIYNLRKEIKAMNCSSLKKEDRAKQILKNVRIKIMQLIKTKKICEKELLDLKFRIESVGGSTGVQGKSDIEHDARLKLQMENCIPRLEHEKSEIQAEKEALLQRIAQFQRQVAGVSGISATMELSAANIKPMSPRAETLLASIKPMNVIVQSRTPVILPTIASASVMIAPHQMQQQSVQTSSLRQLVMQPQLSESTESI